MGVKMIGMVLQVYFWSWWVILMISCTNYDVTNTDSIPRKFVKIRLKIIQWIFLDQADINDWISHKNAICCLFGRFSRLTDMISDHKSTDTIFTYDVISWPWRHWNDSCRPEMNYGKLCGHFDTHKGSMKSFHLDFTFWHMTKMSKEGMIHSFPPNGDYVNRFLCPWKP